MTNQQQIVDFLTKANMYYLATVDAEGQPHVRIFTSRVVVDDKVYIQTNKTKEVFKQILDNPKVEICAFSKGQWMRVTGELVHDDTVEARKKVLDAQPELRTAYHYDENDGVCAVLYFKHATAVTYSFTSDPVSISI
jgi:uncharacterized pyridoxamine 5'-phosphate oxidase family protein